MGEGIFDEYLVKLGFSTDEASYAKFKSVLTESAGIAEDKTVSILKSLGKWQGAILGAFGTIGTAAIVAMDKVADTDLGFQLLAQKMYIGVDAAKQLSIATSILGHDLNEIAWNPELHRRFDILLSDQERMSELLGHGFEAGLRNVRDIRFEFSRMQDELEYGLLPEIVAQIDKGLGGEGLLTRLQKVNDWIISHIPEMASAFSKFLLPILRDAKFVLSDVVGMLEDVGVAFTNLVGLLSGDRSLEGTTLDFEKFMKAVDWTAHGLSVFVGWITEAERMIAHFASAVVLAASAAEDAIFGHIGLAKRELSMAASELHKGVGDLTSGSGAVTGGVVGAGSGALAGGLIGGAFLGPLGVPIGAAIGSPLMGLLGMGGGAGLGWLREKTDPNDKPEHGFDVPGAVTSSPDIHALIDKLAPLYGINPVVAHAVAMAESGERQYDVSGRLVSSGKAYGAMQLTPDTAATYGVNIRDSAQNITGGLRLLSDLNAKYKGNLEEILAAYNWGGGNLDRAIAKNGGFNQSFLPSETRDYIHRIEANLATQGALTVNNNIYAAPGQSAREVGQAASDATVAAIKAHTRRQNTSDTAMLGSPYQ